MLEFNVDVDIINVMMMMMMIWVDYAIYVGLIQ